MNILIVDDNETNRKLLRVTLEAEGLRTVEAGDGIEALGILDREPVDAIISDILMPRMDGYRLCYEVRASRRFHQLPFIVYTNTFDSRGDEKAALEMGADKFLRKPAQVQQIAGTLDELISSPPTGHPRLAAAPHQLELMKEYSEVLVKKLTQKNSELQLAAR
jgi:CheY-like chemotaxis protein